jgi:histidine kinase
MTTFFQNSLVFKLFLTMGLTLAVGATILSWYVIKYQEQHVMEEVVVEANRLTNTIRLGTHYAMMLNDSDDINRIIRNIGQQKEITSIRIYDKKGVIRFSIRQDEIGSSINIKAEACDVCHGASPPKVDAPLDQRKRFTTADDGHRLLGIVTPIYNEPGCSAPPCHIIHPEDKKVLGALDVVVSLERLNRERDLFERKIIGIALLAFLFISGVVALFVMTFVRRPLKELIVGTSSLAEGEPFSPIDIKQRDEVGQLAAAINHMGRKIEEKQAELNRQRKEFQRLFKMVPCIITVQNRDFQLLSYNNEFYEKFSPEPGDYCYRAYKNRSEKCDECPVEMTFNDGLPHHAEQSGFNRDGSMNYWIVKSVPVTNSKGEITAAMEMSVDITKRRMLERKLEKSEKKYHAIFNNIPNPVFVLDPDTLDILDANESVTRVYGYARDRIVGWSFLELFRENERESYTRQIKTIAMLAQVRHVNNDGQELYVDIWISPSEYGGQKVLLVATSDITKRLETERQLIQAGKLATLGEMATGVAHELNQPLSVIKTVSSFLMKKTERRERVEENVLFTMLEKVDSNVDRATKIITHMRMFARESDLRMVPVRINDVLNRAFDIFSQQLKVRGIHVEWDLEQNLPLIKADPDRLEQVFINLLINARDAIESDDSRGKDKIIAIRTHADDERVIVEVRDNGPGILKEHRDKIFDPFFTTKEVGKGTGLGLSISYGIVKECGGMIRLASEDSEGACFLLQFPRMGYSDAEENTLGG